MHGLSSKDVLAVTCTQFDTVTPPSVDWPT
jgi:hypothetical protein